MDSVPAPDAYPELSYDDTAYEAQLPTAAEQQASLANRIGRGKVYLLSETVSRVGSKRKHDDADAMDEDDVDMDEDSNYRGNALLFRGSPIGSLPTAGLFAYATHFDVHPLGLEWVDDECCVFVFDSKADARNAYRLLQKHITEEPDAEGFLTAKPIPVAIWPPEERINDTLGSGQGLRGIIRMRWARAEDVKKRGSKASSQFYKKHGWGAGKEQHYEDGGPAPGPPASKRRRREGSADTRDRERAALDAELDAFIQGDDEPEFDAAPEPEPEPAPEPVSKMRSDYIASDGRTLLERTSVMRLQPDADAPVQSRSRSRRAPSDLASRLTEPVPDLESRLTAPLPRRARGMYADMLEDTPRDRDDMPLEWGRDDRDTQWGRERERDRDLEPRRNGRIGGNNSRRDDRRRNERDDGRRSARGGGERERRSRNERPAVTREDLDAELDAFLEDKI